ncbi:MAG: RNA polymerase sigma factor [Gammaproteobacteria bacterium]|nr:RNA polymerase sigma factor [Gammaproteobacteria bacterium]
MDRDADAAADVLQQSYLVIVEGGARFEGRSSLKTFLFGVVHRCALRHQRGRKRRFALVQRYAAEPQASDPPPESQSDVRMRRALQALPRRQRDVLELVIYADLTLEQTAAVLNVSVGSVRTHYHRAKQTLRTQLEHDHE